PVPPVWPAASLRPDVTLLVGSVLLFIVFLVSGRPPPSAALVFLWMGYYLFMLVVVFHNEIRYRSAFVPLLLAGAAAGASVLLDRTARRRPLVPALSIGLVLAVLMIVPFAGPATHAVRAWWPLRPARGAL